MDGIKLKKGGIMDTHYLDLRIGIDSIDLVKEGNIEGAKVALGVSEDANVLSEFCNMLAEKIGASISKFSNVSIVNGNITLAQQQDPVETLVPKQPQYDELSTPEPEPKTVFGDGDVDMDEEIPLIPDSQGGEESYIDEATGKLLVKSFDTVFDVRNQGGNIIKFIVKNDIYNTSILERELNLAHDEVEINESIEEDYIVQYTDVEGNNQIIGGNIIG